MDRNTGRPRTVSWGRVEVLATEAVVIASVGIIAGATRFGAGPSTLSAGDLLVLVVLAVPAVALVPLTMTPVLRHLACLIALLAWVPIAYGTPDISCVDCAFVLMIPMMLAPVQLVLCLASNVWKHHPARDRPEGTEP